MTLGFFECYSKSVIDEFKSHAGDNKFVCIQNKVDINIKKDDCFDCCVSAKTGEGFEVLKEIIVNCFNSKVDKKKYNYLVRERHENIFNEVVHSLGSAYKGLEQGTSLELVAEDLKNARSGFDELVGKKFSDSLLGDIFNSYCIGK